MATTKEKRDYYEVLGVDRSATKEALKQAYRQLALEWHPDRNKSPEATERFREIAEAYAVLSDDAKRRAYDAGGHAGMSEQWTTEDLMRDFQFGEFFGGRLGDLSGIFGNLFRTPRTPAGPPRGHDLHFSLELTLEEAEKGGERLVEFRRSEKCRACEGTGAKAGTKPVQCADCNGSGQKQRSESGKGIRTITLTACSRCKGRGQFIESPCASCAGEGYERVPHAVKAQIPPGVDDGMVIRLAGQGEPSTGGGPSGDLLIATHVRPHPNFKRQGDELLTIAEISFPEAALGTKVSIPGLDGKAFSVTVPPGVQSGTALRVRGKGMPRLGGKGRGNLLVVVEVRTPTDLTPRERELLQEWAKLKAKRSKAGTTS
jgi:molecular chaperone DnaJ